MKVSWEISRWERWTLSFFALITTAGLAVGVAAWREAHAEPRITRYEVEAAGLPRGTAVTIAFLSDTHVNQSGMASAIGVERLSAIADRVNRLGPDIVVLGGDYIATTGAPGDVPFAAAVAPFSRLTAPLGVYAVVGNHDCQEPENTSSTMKAALRAAGVRPLVNEIAVAGPVMLAGLDDLWCGASDIGTADRAIGAAGDRPVVLVSHNPDVFPQVLEDVSLTLAGHTHAGQIVPPFMEAPVSVSRFGNRYRYGLIREGGRRMIVTSGIGGMPFRWNAEPEIVLVTLRAPS